MCVLSGKGQQLFRYIIKRVFCLIPVLLVISIITFLLTHLSAGDAASIIVRGTSGQQTQEAINIVKEELGLDQPLAVQYGRWLGNVLRGDFGVSYMTKKPVRDELKARFPATFQLAVCSFGLLLLISLPLGLLSSVYPDSYLDKISRFFSFLTVSIPSFWLGLALLYVFGVYLKWIPVVGTHETRNVWVPALTLSLGFAGSYIRLIRTSMLEVLGKQYIQALRAKGLRERLVICRHALKNAIVPTITRLGATFGGLLGGSAIVESIFSWQGLGKYALDAIGNKDLPSVQGYVLLMAAVVVGINLFVDILYVCIDPQIQLG